jgi:signal transduction histidine kinase
VRRRSIGLPLSLGITLAVIALALGVGWQLLVVFDLEPATRGLGAVRWVLIILGSVLFVAITAGLVGLAAWLVREMRLNQRQQAFLDAVTHEMKTPLASLRLYLETLERRDPEPARRREFLVRMGEDVERLEHTVDQVLAAARAEGRGKRQPVPVDLAGLLAPTIVELRERHGLDASAIRVREEAPVSALGNPAELAVVFRNLIENAIKYSDPTVDVTVTLRERGDGRVQVEIADRGIGIERRELRKIFQRFYRAGRDVQRQAAGLGLGLFIVGNLVRRNGGRVEARSEGSGQGSRFVVTLAAAQAPETVPTTRPSTQAVG